MGSAHYYLTTTSTGSHLWQKSGLCDHTGDKSLDIAGFTCDPDAWAPEKGPCCRLVADFLGGKVTIVVVANLDFVETALTVTFPMCTKTTEKVTFI